MAQRLKQATKKALKNARTIDLVDSIAGSTEADVEFVDETDMLSYVAGEYIKRVDRNITDVDLATDGSALKLTISEVTDTRLTISGPSHIVFVDQGVNGTENKTHNSGPGYTTKRPPVNKILAWMKKKNLVTGTTDGKGKAFKDQDTADLSRAYAIRENLFKEGQEPTYVYSSEIPQLIADIAVNFKGFTSRNIIEDFNKKNK